MKIGIITFWQTNDNYGQVLQAYALQQHLRKQGHEPFIIRYDFENKKPHRTIWSYIKLVIKTFLVIPVIKKRKLEKEYQNEWTVINEKNKQRQFEEFKNKYIVYSKLYYRSIKSLRQIPPEADCYITGSDQVWAQLLSEPENSVCFLDFGDNSIKRIAYAPSFAMNNYPSNLLPLLKAALSRFDYISVRETTGVEICKSVGFDAIKVLDPTLLLTCADYISISDIQKQEPYIYIYSLNIRTPEDIRFNELKCNFPDKKVIVTPGSGVYPGKELFDDVTYEYASIGQWLDNIKKSDLFVTTSFHGVVLAIILHANFVYVPLRGYWSKMNNRVLDLLEQVKMSQRVLSDDVDYADIISEKCSWENVDYNLNNLRQSSIEYLQQSLSRHEQKKI